MAAATLTFEGGTVRIDGDLRDDTLADLPGVEADPRSGTARAPAYRYADLRAALEERGAAVVDAADAADPDAATGDGDVTIDDRVLDLPDLPALATTYELRDYQQEAFDAWREAGDRGVVELPTGSGKTVVAVAAIAALSTPTLVVVPTIDLLEQWRRELEAEFDVPVGQFGGGEQRREAITVSTYDSAYLRADGVGDRFGLAVYDEAHHLGSEGYRDAARLLAAPARMGLTATFERPDGAHEAVADLVGPRVYRRSADDLAGDHLAPYDVKRLEVALTDEEREAYERHQTVFTDYLARSNIQLRSASDYQELVKRSGTDPAAREALLAKQRAREIMMGSDAKLDALADVLDRHRGDRVIVFTAHNDTVYRIAERFLVPAITHRTPADERREILDRFREGTYSRVVSSNVLDEGVDVPDANVAVLLSGSGSEREFTQRLGRILRPKEAEGSESGDPEARERAPSSLGGRALLYEVVSEETAEERVARRRR